MPRLYTATEPGRRAWDTQSARVPLDCRRVLGCIEKDTSAASIGRTLGWSEAAVQEVLDELQAGGLVTSVDTGPEKNPLDFTDSFRLEDIQAALRRQGERKELDFTGALSTDALRAAQDKSK
jgi:hypothetical protein